jgi:hypothetical protein
MRKLTIQRSLTLLAGLLLLAWPALRVKAFNPQPDPPAFGLIGVDPFETARLNAVCADGPLPGEVAPGPCDIVLVFRDISGRALKQMTATLLPGQGTSLDLRGAEVLSPTAVGDFAGRRVDVHPWIRPAGRGFIFATVEVFDNLTGRVDAALNPTEAQVAGAAYGWRVRLKPSYQAQIGENDA